MCTQSRISINCDVCHKRYTSKLGNWGECNDRAEGKGCDGTRDDWVDSVGGTCGVCIVSLDKAMKRRSELEEEGDTSDEDCEDGTI